MSAVSFKSIAVAAGLGLAALFSAAAANAAPMSAPVAGVAAHDAVVNVDYRPHMRRGPACSPRDAEFKASRMGVRNPRAVMRGRTIEVRGFRGGHPTRILFANSRGCPALR